MSFRFTVPKTFLGDLLRAHKSQQSYENPPDRPQGYACNYISWIVHTYIDPGEAN